MSNTYPWGVWSGWSFRLAKTFSFLSEPEGGTFQEGGSLSWTVLTDGAEGTPVYTWYKGTVPIQGRTDSSFSIDSLKLEDSGWYSCRVTDGNGTTVETDPVFVTVKAMNAIPAAGVPALALAALCILFSARRLRRRA